MDYELTKPKLIVDYTVAEQKTKYEFNYDKTNGISLAYQSGTKFQIGDRVFIRAR